ncbi:hypothetical protein [Oceanicoccus sp. KOV_DT_Chl]|uniref:hypothetical protein n=1 Tax=Oceanicoccus sp. KOV_DT_Chl TaxID=1904639 RepID=UPI000C7D86D6|nr:hypothetical protein [Oceanicoccus sp. KOV_DT_Chl]
MKLFTNKILALAAAGALINAAVVDATEYALEPSVKVSTEHNNNYRLQVDNTESLFGYTVTPSINGQINEENWNVALDIDLDFSRFNRTELNTDDQNVNLSYVKQGETYYVNVFAGLVRDTTRTSEIEDSGRVGIVDRHENYSLGTSSAYIFDESNRLNFSVSAVESKYDAIGRTDYQYFQGQLGWEHTLTEKLSLSVIANTSIIKYEPVDALVAFQQTINFFGQLIPIGDPEIFQQSRESTTDSAGWTAQIDYKLTEKLKFTASYGESDTETSYEISDPENACSRAEQDPLFIPLNFNFCSLVDPESSVANWDVNTEWANERQELSLTYSNSLQPSSDGVVIESERVRLKWAYAITQHGRIAFDSTWGENKALDEPLNSDVSSVNRTFLNAVIRYRHRFAERWYANVALRYNNQEREIFSGVAESGAIEVSVKYQPVQQSWSR